MGYMTRRTFVEIGAIASGAAVLTGLVGCGSAAQSSDSGAISSTVSSASDSASAQNAESNASSSSSAPHVYFTRALDSAGLQAVFAAIGVAQRGVKERGLTWSTGCCHMAARK